MKLCIHLEVQLCLSPQWTALVCNDSTFDQQCLYFLLVLSLPLLIRVVWVWDTDHVHLSPGIGGHRSSVSPTRANGHQPQGSCWTCGKEVVLFSTELSSWQAMDGSSVVIFVWGVAACESSWQESQERERNLFTMFEHLDLTSPEVRWTCGLPFCLYQVELVPVACIQGVLALQYGNA